MVQAQGGRKSRVYSACNSRSNQFTLFGRGDPIMPNIPGLIHRRDLKFEDRIWLDLVCVRLIPSWNTSEVSIEVVVLLACIMDHAACPLFRPLDRTMQADGVITLATKTDKDAPVMTRA
ncbi:hypothetical protein HAX54_028666, partial [Datura stramonium]|nr:hypothetical protein [Datura stramonium]